MDFEDREDEQEGLPKWPFLASALFILCAALGFAYFHYHSSGQLEVWQLLVCILASGTASLLIFMPFLLERSLQLCLLTANRKDDELFRKVYFDLKEVGNELEALAVKVDKVPTLVDKIVSDSTKDLSQLNQLSSELSETKEELVLKLARLEELATQESPPPETDTQIARTNQAIADLAQSVSELTERLDDIKSGIDKIPTEFPAPVIQTIPTADQPSAVVAQSVDQEKEITKKEASIEEILAEDDSSSPDLSENEPSDDPAQVLEVPTPEEAEPTFEELEDRIDKENPEDSSSDDKFEEDEQPVEPTDDESPVELEEKESEPTESKLEEETFDDLELEEAEDQLSETQAEEEPEELDLGLPAPKRHFAKWMPCLPVNPPARLRLRKKKSPPRKHPVV